MMEALLSSIRLALTRTTRRHIPEDSILYRISVYETNKKDGEKWRNKESDFHTRIRSDCVNCILHHQQPGRMVIMMIAVSTCM
jgi:hypothetical protein